MRQQAQVAGPVEIAFFTSLIMTSCFLARRALPRGAAAGRRSCPAIVGAAALAFGSLILLSWAYARAEAQQLAPVEYTAFIWAAIFGWLVFAEPVQPLTLVGAAMIVVACLVAARRRAEPVRRCRGGRGGRLMAWLLPHPRRPVRGRLHHLPALRRRLPEPALDARLPRLGDPVDGPARTCRARPSRWAPPMRSGAGSARSARCWSACCWFGEPATTIRMLLILAIIACIVGLKLTGMSFDEGLYAWVQEALEPLGAVTMRKMMGGATLYLDGTIFAILDEDEIWFKADAESRRDLGRGGLRALHRHLQGRQGRHDELPPRADRRLRRCRGDAALGARSRSRRGSAAARRRSGRRRSAKAEVPLAPARARRPQMRRDLRAFLDRAAGSAARPACCDACS